MNKNDNPEIKQVAAIDDDGLLLLSSEPAAIDNVDVHSPRMTSLRARVMAQTEEPFSPDLSELLTIKAASGDWQQISDKIRKKILHIDKQKGLASYLLRIDPGAEDAPHRHTSDEHCMVLEGDVSFGDVHLHAGDYHLAPEGSWHDKAYSEHGALLYIQTGIEQSTSL